MKKVLTILVATILSTNFAISTDNNIEGDKYWSQPKSSSFDYNNISASNIKKIAKDSEKSKVSIIKMEMLQSAALQFGAQVGLAKEAERINKLIKSHEKELDSTFNFEKQKIEQGLMAPVVSYGNNAYNQVDDKTVRAADRIYKIEFPARIVTATPDWREYLYLDVIDPEAPSNATLPSGGAENKIWDEFVFKGLDVGKEQAWEIYEDNVGRLDRDYNGMTQYFIENAKNKISRPKLTRKELGVTGGGNELSIGDRVIEKAKEAKFNPNSKTWYK